MTSLQNLFVAKLPRNLTDADLEQIFTEFKPTSAKIMLDATTGKSKGFGFVLFESEDAGKCAYEALNKTHVTLHGHSFNLCIFPSKHDGKIATEESNALYIRNIPHSLSQLEVEQFLRKFGNLAYCAMREDHYGGPVWVVYAEYETVDEAKSALQNLHGNKTYFNYPVAVLAKFADSEEAKRERRRRREQQALAPPSPHPGSPQLPPPSSPHSPHPAQQQQMQQGPLPPPPPPPPPPPSQPQIHHPSPPPLMHPGAATQHFHPMPHTRSLPDMAMDAIPSSGSPRPMSGGPGSGGMMMGNGNVSPGAPIHHFVPGSSDPTGGSIGQATGSPGTGQQTMYGGPSSGPLLTTAGGAAGNPNASTPLTGSFLNAAFQTMASGQSGHSYSRFSPLEPSPNGRGSPLNLSFGPDPGMDLLGGTIPTCNQVSGALATNGAAPTTPLLATTPVRRNSNLSASGTYRHNPYAPVTPVSSSTPSSVGPSSPLMMPTASAPIPTVAAHFGSPQQHHSPATGVVGTLPLVPPPSGYTSSHFAS